MNNIEALKKCPLFKGVPEYSITAVMGCLRARGKTLRQKRICISYRRSHKRDRHSSFGQTANNKRRRLGEASP